MARRAIMWPGSCREWWAVFAALLLALSSAPALAQAPVPVSQCITQALAGGTGDAITSAALPCIPTTATVYLKLTATNATTTPTYQPLGASALQIKRNDGSNVGVGELASGLTVTMISNGTNWLVLNGLPGMARNAANATLPDARVNLGAMALDGTDASNGAWANIFSKVATPDAGRHTIGLGSADSPTFQSETLGASGFGGSIKVPPPWAALIHQNNGGLSTGHNLLWADQNIGINADFMSLTSTDASLAVSGTVTGTPTSTETPGLNLTVNAIPYTIRYTVQPGDTNTLIAQHLASGLNQTPDAHVVVTPSTFYADLRALGYITQAYNSTNTINGDLPFGIVTAFTGVNSANTTVTVASYPSSFSLDNGPFVAAVRSVAGRTPRINDNIGWWRADGQSTSSSGVDTQYAGLKGRVGIQDASNPEGTISLEGSGVGGGNKGSVPLFSCQASLGCWIESATTSNPNRALSASKGGLGLTGTIVQSTASTGAVGTFASTGANGWLSIGGSGSSMLVGAQGASQFIQSSNGNPLLINQSGGNLGILGIGTLQMGPTSGASLTTTALSIDGSGNLVVQSATNKQVIESVGGGSVTTKLTSTDLIFGQGSALPTTATAGFLYINSMAGAPTGAPAAWATGVIPIVINTTDHKICWNETGAGAGWKCATGL